MTTTTWQETNLEAWHNATADLRKAIFEEHYPIHLAAIEAERTGKVKKENRITHTQIKQARNMANGDVINALYNLAEYNGVTNPSHSDPIWGPNAKQVEEAPKVKANRYGGRCPQCDGWVEAGEGKLVKVAGKWGAEHITCPKVEEAPKPQDGIDLSGLVAGYYAVPGGDTRLKLAISHGKNKWNGYTFVKDAAEYGQQERYGMQRPGQSYRGKVEDALRTILADPKAAMAAYGKLVGRCGACGRKLEDEASVAAGIGPICAGKFDGLF